MEETNVKQMRSGKGSFRVPVKAIDTLIDLRASAWQIAVYLTIAMHTDATGKFSTAGYKVIGKSTGALPGTKASPGAGVRIVRDLMAMTVCEGKKKESQRLLYSPEEWISRTGESIPETPNKLYPVSFVINDFNTDEWVWMPNELVEGYGRFIQPLKRLKQCGDIAARILIHSYKMNNMEEFGGIPPYKNFYNMYKTTNPSVWGGFAFFSTLSTVGYTDSPLAYRLLGESKTSDKEQLKPYWNALKALESNGFMYEVVTVMDGNPDAENTRPIYELWIKGRHGVALKGEEGVADKIDSFLTARRWERASDSMGRFYDKFNVITRAGIPSSVVGIYRLRFRVANPKNYTVTSSWQRIQGDREAFLADLRLLEDLWPLGDVT